MQAKKPQPSTVAVPNPVGLPFLAISISSISQRLSYARALELVPLFKATAQSVSDRLQHLR